MYAPDNLTPTARVRITVERHETYRRLINAVVGLLTLVLVSATVSWVGINYIAGCGAIDPITRTANLDACILYPTNN
jgi:hypothetical protein